MTWRPFRFSLATFQRNCWKVVLLRRKIAAMSTPSNNQHPDSCFRVLGVDPAAAGPTGYGILETDGKICQVVHYGAFRVPTKRQKNSLGAVLDDIHQLLSKLLEEYKPQAMAVESVFTALNMRTALRLAEVRGVVLLAAEQHQIEVRSYSPREVKACVAGYGHADKRQMQMMVRALLHMEEMPEPSHAADALAIGLCYLQARQLEQRFGVSKERVLSRKIMSAQVSPIVRAEARGTRMTRIPTIR